MSPQPTSSGKKHPGSGTATAPKVSENVPLASVAWPSDDVLAKAITAYDRPGSKTPVREPKIPFVSLIVSDPFGWGTAFPKIYSWLPDSLNSNWKPLLLGLGPAVPETDIMPSIVYEVSSSTVKNALSELSTVSPRVAP
jgi:hypothetical protein